LILPKEQQKRIPYSTTLIFMLGGITGSVLNLSVNIFFYKLFSLNPYFCFFCGTLLNLLYHHLYYHVVFDNKEIRIKTSLYLQMTLYGMVTIGSLVIFGLFFDYLKFGFVSAVILSILCLSLFSTLFVRISNFASAQLANVAYADIDDNYYDTLIDAQKVSQFRAWYHSSRFRRLAMFIADYYQPGMKIADLGCGSCSWNTDGFPVTGIDINENMIRRAYENNRLVDYHVAKNLALTNLPSNSFDIIVMSETLEHVANIEEVLVEVKRVLKDNGTFIITVPYDLFLGPFFILFNLNCLYMGYIRGSIYHRFRCGHINHFTKRRLVNIIETNGFAVNKMSIVNWLLIYTAAQKRHFRYS